MSRIMAQFTFASAVLVVLALVVQREGAEGPFRPLALGLGAAVLLTGTLTAMRVHYASHEDAQLVRGMNRLRRAYLDLDPGIEPYLVAGYTDDGAGVVRTYTVGPLRNVTQLLASASMFITSVTALVAGGWVGILVSPFGKTVSVVLGVVASPTSPPSSSRATGCTPCTNGLPEPSASRSRRPETTMHDRGVLGPAEVDDATVSRRTR